MSKGGLTQHLPACPELQEAIRTADRQPGHNRPIYHLQVQDAWSGDYWLHLEIKGSARLADLDGYLRAIWLECCNHLSMFSLGGWGTKEFHMDRRVQPIFEPGLELTHIHDFGTESVSRIKVVGMRKGKPLTKHRITLLARNDEPDWRCIDCGKPAAWLCLDCMYKGEHGTLCDEHVEEHPHYDYGEPMPLVNSPRVGLCGYAGPAEPPY
jgi:hypothetical protein